jgi:hypothetical protein
MTSALTLRPYQQEAITAIQRALERGVRRPLIVLPTGTGKTSCFSALIARRGGSALVLAHRDELLRQAAEKIAIADPTLALGPGSWPRTATTSPRRSSSAACRPSPRHADSNDSHASSTRSSLTLPLALFLYGLYVLGAVGPRGAHSDGDVRGHVTVVRHGVGLPREFSVRQRSEPEGEWSWLSENSRAPARVGPAVVEWSGVGARLGG